VKRAWLAIALMLSFALPVRAHIGHVVERAERYLKLDVTPGDARFVVSLTLGPTEMERVLGAADADDDGRVTEGEAEAYVRTWGEGLDDVLTVRVDGELDAFSWGEPFLQPIGDVRPVGGSVELVGHVELGAGRVAIVIEDRMARPAIERTDVSLETRNGVRLVAAGPGADPAGIEPRFAFGPGAPRPVVFAAIVETEASLIPARRHESALGWVLAAMTATGVLAFVAMRLGRAFHARRRRAANDG
jgi:hypothetical protein